MSMKHVCSPKSKTKISGVDLESIQPNALDLKLDKVFKISDNLFEIDNDTKVHRGSEPVEPNADGWFELEPGAYEVIMDNIISVSDNEAGFVITRSTLNRNDVFLTSGLYDSGYNGKMAACMHVGSGNMIIKKGTRIGQYLSFDAESLHRYDGDYGLGKEHDTKY